LPALDRFVSGVHHREMAATADDHREAATFPAGLAIHHRVSAVTWARAPDSAPTGKTFELVKERFVLYSGHCACQHFLQKSISLVFIGLRRVHRGTHRRWCRRRADNSYQVGRIANGAHAVMLERRTWSEPRLPRVCKNRRKPHPERISEERHFSLCRPLHSGARLFTRVSLGNEARWRAQRLERKEPRLTPHVHARS